VESVKLKPQLQPGHGGRWYSRSTCPAASNAGRRARRVLIHVAPSRLHVLAQCQQPCHASCATAASNRAKHPERGCVDCFKTRRGAMASKGTLRVIAYLCSPSFHSSRRAFATRPLLRRGCAAVRDARFAGGKDRVETSHTCRSRPHRARGAGAGPAAAAVVVAVVVVVVVSTQDS
jgi:hypothetical protein